MAKRSGNQRIKKKMLEFFKQVNNPENFTLEEVVLFYEKEHGRIYNNRRLASLIYPYATAEGTRRNRYWKIRNKWRNLNDD